MVAHQFVFSNPGEKIVLQMLLFLPAAKILSLEKSFVNDEIFRGLLTTLLNGDFSHGC